MKKLLALCLPLLLAVASARADLIWYEGFQYPNGNLTNVSGGIWKNFSGSGLSDMYVKNNILEVSASAGTLTPSRTDDNRRPFATVPGSPYTNTVQPVYASFTVICTNLPNGAGSYFASFYNPKSGNGGGFFGRVQAFTNGTVLPNTWRLGVTANALAANPANGGFPVDLALNTPYQVVEELDPVTLLAATIWVNPVDLNDTGTTGTDPKYISSDNINYATNFPVSDYAFRQAGSFGNSFFAITNLATATTFAQALTNVWSTNAVAPVIVYQPASVTTNFQNSTVSLSAVANGQGLGSLTYQWQVSSNPGNTSPVNVSGGNANVLSVDTSAVGTSYYTLIVTTPHGLSSTSSIAKVAIIPPSGPPSFVVQPKSQIAYVGQTATLTTTVLSPGNTTYTWYSNNVVVTAGQVDSGLSSSYIISGLTLGTNTYKVAVTNDTSAIGIVSTNAILGVTSPAAVSIGYLRTLVDPVTFLPNVPASQPFEVTGVITTYTNTTTGNTASYWLQDGTGGINIFATLGSSFRPAQGDSVTYVGVLSSFTSGLELVADPAIPPTSYVINSSGNPLPPAKAIPFTLTNTVPLSFINTNYAGSLVTLTGVYFGTNFGTTITAPANGSLSVTVTNSTGGKFILSFFSQVSDTQGQILPEYASSVTGVLYGLSPNYTVAITKFSDIVAAPVPPLTPVLNLTTSGSTLTLTWTGAAVLQASTNVAGPYAAVPGATSPFVTNGAASSVPTQFFRLQAP